MWSSFLHEKKKKSPGPNTYLKSWKFEQHTLYFTFSGGNYLKMITKNMNYFYLVQSQQSQTTFPRKSSNKTFPKLARNYPHLRKRSAMFEVVFVTFSSRF